MQNLCSNLAAISPNISTTHVANVFCLSKCSSRKKSPLVLLIPNVPRTSTFKRAELFQTSPGTLNNFNIGNLGCCWRSDLSLQSVGTACTFHARMGDIPPWTTDTDDIRGSSSRQAKPLMCSVFHAWCSSSLVMQADGRDISLEATQSQLAQMVTQSKLSLLRAVRIAFAFLGNWVSPSAADPLPLDMVKSCVINGRRTTPGFVTGLGTSVEGRGSSRRVCK